MEHEDDGLPKIKETQVYESIVFNSNLDKDMVLKALEIVKLFIIKRKRILVGGMSIDYALRKKGKRLYPDNTLPDYDFFSPKFHEDAYDIAAELFKAGLNHISVINAFHVSTMRVRVRFHVVADCTYIPENLYEGLPTVSYELFRVIHPHYQMLNQHLALCMPYAGAPRETINRWGKDMIRFNILDREYPVENKYEPDQMVLGDISPWVIDIKEVSDLCLNGFGAIVYWHSIAKLDGFSEEDCVASEWAEFEKLGSLSTTQTTVNLTIPTVQMGEIGSIGISWYCDRRNILGHPYVKKNSKPEVLRVNAFLDLLPRRYMISGSDSRTCEILDNRGDMIAAHRDKIWIANPQVLLKYFLLNYIVSFNILKQRNGYSLYVAYRLAYSITKWACLKYKKADPAERVQYMKYLPTHVVYGKHNWYETYITQRKSFQAAIGKIPRDDKFDMPRSAFIDSKEDFPIAAEKYKFDPLASPIYQFDYRESKSPFADMKLYDSVIDKED